MLRRRLIPVWIGIILLSGMFLMGQASECPWGSHLVDFPDPGLEAAIRDSIGQLYPYNPDLPPYEGPLCTRNLLRVLFLYAGDYDITDLSGLEYCKFVGMAYLHQNQISDISPLAGLTGLEYLDLHYNQISDVYPLVQNSGIGDGDTVYLDFNPLNDTSCTVYIPELQSRGVNVYHNCP